MNSTDDLITSLLIDLIILGIFLVGSSVAMEYFGIQLQVPM